MNGKQYGVDGRATEASFTRYLKRIVTTFRSPNRSEAVERFSARFPGLSDAVDDMTKMLDALPNSSYRLRIFRFDEQLTYFVDDDSDDDGLVVAVFKCRKHAPFMAAPSAILVFEQPVGPSRLRVVSTRAVYPLWEGLVATLVEVFTEAATVKIERPLPSLQPKVVRFSFWADGVKHAATLRQIKSHDRPHDQCGYGPID